MTSSFWKALKTIFITFGQHQQQQQQSLDKRKHKNSKHKHIDYSSSIIDDSYLHVATPNTPNSINNSNNNNSNNNNIGKININNNSNQPDHLFLPNHDLLDEDMIEWPQWALDLGKRPDLHLISRNGLDVDSQRNLAGFKGRNFVYQDRKFVTCYYWKGYSSIIYNNNSNNSISNEQQQKQLLPETNSTEQTLSFDINNRMLIGYVFWNINCEGPPGCVHGGALASVFDDSMACCIRYYYNNNYDEDEEQADQTEQPIKKKYAVTANLSVNYKKFVPLLSVSLIETKIEKREGKKIFVTSVMKDQYGSIRAEATAVWIVVNMSAVVSPSSISTPTSNSPFSSTPE